jgi:RNA polymerase sigma factor (sigma-70 family)
MTTLVGSRSGAGEARLSFDDFFQASAREVAAIVALTTGDVGLAEDATQEAMARAYSHWTRVSKLDRPDLWVIRVAANIAIDTWRKRRREVNFATSAVSATTPSDEVTALWVRWAMDRLTPEDRLLLILRHRDDMSIDEIGVSLSRSPHTVATYLKRARRRLRAILAEDDS